MKENEIDLIGITSSDEFLDLEKSAQTLYFHLYLLIDDDRTVRDIKRRVREYDCSVEDLKELIDARFLIAGLFGKFDINKITSVTFARDMAFIRIIGDGRKNGI